MAIENYVAKHEIQLKGALEGRKHLENVTNEDEKLQKDRVHIDEVMANTNYLHGDGLFPLRDGNRNLIDSNGKVTATGNTRTVTINDYLALIDGYRLGNKVLDSNKVFVVNIEVSSPTLDRIDIICLKPSLDISGNKQHTHGDVYVIKGVSATIPVAPSVLDGSILLAKVKVNKGTTVVLNTDIIDSRDFLLDIDDLNSNLGQRVIEVIDEIKRELYSLILQEIEVVKEEISNGDNAIKIELQSKIDILKVDIANLTIDVTVIREEMGILKDYVNEKIEELNTQSVQLQTAILNLQNANEETEEFKTNILEKVIQSQGQILANTIEIQNNLQRIESLELKLAVGAGLGNLTTLINIAKTNFKIDAYHNANSNNMFKGFVDVFADDLGIDSNLSSNYIVDKVNQNVMSAPMLDSSIQAYWNMNEGQGNLNLDSSPNGNHAIIIGGDWTEGKFNGGFNGYRLINYSDSSRPIWNLTILCWIDVTLPLYIGKYFFGNAYNDYVGYGIGLDPSTDDVVYFYINNPNNKVVTPIESNKFSFIAVTYEGHNYGLKKIYKNGQLIQSQVSDSVQDIPIIYDNTSPLLLWNHLDDLAVYNKVLSAQEILDIYNSNIEIGALGAGNPAIIITESRIADSIPASVLLVAEANEEVTYQVSRDNGVTWINANNNEITEFPLETPEGNSIRVKITIPSSKSLNNLALFWN